MKSLIALSLFGCAVCAGSMYGLPRRQALIIGNDSYPGNPLKNARNDAKGVAEALGALGYATILQVDVDRKTMGDSISMFANGLNPGDVALVYYSGHGLQVDGENYLVPIDFQVSAQAEVRNQGYPLSAVLDKIASRGASTQVIILDACRDNPFLGSRSLRGGWANVSTSAGTFLAFGTAPGSTASDNPGESHGLFTKALLRYLSLPNLNINQLFDKVREDTIRESHGLQVPWTASSLVGTLHLAPQMDSGGSLALQDLPPFRSTEESSESHGTRSAIPQSPASGQKDDAASFNILVNQGLLLAKQKNYDEAVRSLSAALALDPRSSIALRVLGLIFHLLGRSIDAVNEFDRALSADPTDATAYYYRCLAVSSNDPLSAVRDCEAAVGLDPSFVSAHVGLSNALLLMGQPNKAYAEANTAIRLDPSLPLAYSMRGQIEATLGEYSAAQRDYSFAVRLLTSSEDR